MTSVLSSALCYPDHAQRYECTEEGSVEMIHGKSQDSDNIHGDCFVLHTEAAAASLVVF